MPNTLYVVGLPAGDPDDLTLRARRVLRQVPCVAAGEPDRARPLLARLESTALVVAVDDEAGVRDALERGDVVLLIAGQLPGPSGPELMLIQAAIERGLAVVPVPGPALPITALVLSGLPADSFVFLGEMPLQVAARRRLLASVADERRTLVAVEDPDRLALTLVDLEAALGDRPLAVAVTAGQESSRMWRGALSQALGQGILQVLTLDTSPPLPGPCVLVVGGARHETAAWDEDRLLAGIDTCLAQGMRTKEIGQQLAAESGWSRREIYGLVVERLRVSSNDERET
jgi:16S rRNA (cytidine1402-2'-O)-methyltransferase